MIRTAAYLLPLFLLALAHWLDGNFGRPPLEQILYHVNPDAVGEHSSHYAVTFAVEVVAIPLLIAVVLARWHPHRWAAGALLVPALWLLSTQVSLGAYVAQRFGPDVFSVHYVAPAPLTKPPTKNLALVYVEGLETTFGDRLAPLRIGHSFTLRPAPGTGWTMGGIVGTQCGIPLHGRRDGAFLPGAVCLGDVLARHGYHNVFMGGARLGFGDKGKFLQAHGYHETFGSSEWLARGEHRGFSDWGIHDDDLFRFARDKLVELHKAGKPFNLTLLTVDTHPPEGMLSPTCKARGAKDFDGVVRCTAELVREFADFAAPYAQVVIMGDHLSMTNPLTPELERGDRTIYNAFIGDGKPVATELLPFDLLPTVLEFLGADIPGGRLALGVGGFSTQRAAPIGEGLLNHSAIYERLWDVDSGPQGARKAPAATLASPAP